MDSEWWNSLAAGRTAWALRREAVKCPTCGDLRPARDQWGMALATGWTYPTVYSRWERAERSITHQELRDVLRVLAIPEPQFKTLVGKVTRDATRREIALGAWQNAVHDTAQLVVGRWRSVQNG